MGSKETASEADEYGYDYHNENHNKPERIIKCKQYKSWYIE